MSPDWVDKPRCDVCDSQFSLATRRHHCRLCARCTCSKCSQSTLELESFSGVHRVCKYCAVDASTIIGVKRTLRSLGTRFHKMCGVEICADAADSLEEVVEFCKESSGPVEDILTDLRSRRDALACQAKVLRDSLAAAQRLARVLGEQICVLVGVSPGLVPESLDAILSFSNAQIPILKKTREMHLATLTRAKAAEASEAHLHEKMRELKAQLRDAVQFCSGLDGSLEMAALDPFEPELGERGRCASDVKSPVRRATTSLVLCNVGAEKACDWVEDTTNCSICNVEFSKISIKRRPHHCRICGKCVCSSCSPSSVQLRGSTSLERVCTPCIGNAESAAEMRDMAVELATRLTVLCGLPPPERSQLQSLGEALSFCESALAPLEALLGGTANSSRAADGDGDGAHDLSPSPSSAAGKLKLVEARAEAVRLQRRLSMLADRHAILQSWARSAKGSAVALKSRLEPSHSGSLVAEPPKEEVPSNACDATFGEFAVHSSSSSSSALLARGDPPRTADDGGQALNPFEGASDDKTQNPFEEEVDRHACDLSVGAGCAASGAPRGGTRPPVDGSGVGAMLEGANPFDKDEWPVAAESQLSSGA